MSLPILKASDCKGGYSPTGEELQKMKYDMNTQFMLSGDGIFHTVQGEGNWIGRPTTFIRLHFCNLKCSWCDSWYTWKMDEKEFFKEPFPVDIIDLSREITKAQHKKVEDYIIPRVTFTGGEPLLQQKAIKNWLETQAVDWEVEIETNGTIMPSDYLLERVKFNCSPKLMSAGNDKKLAYNTKVVEAIVKNSKEPCFKFVARTERDIDEVLKDFGEIIPRSMIYIMPEGVTKEESSEVYEKISDKIIFEGLCTTPRLQNIMFDGAKRGV